MRTPILISLAALTLVAAPAAAQKGDSKRITSDDILAHPEVKTALDAVKRIRPNFLRLPNTTYAAGGAGGNGATGRIERSLFVDEVLQERLDNLADVAASDVVEIRVMTPEEVVLYLGKQDHIFGAIAVTTIRSKPRKP